MKNNRGEPDHPYWKKSFSRQEMAIVWLGLGAACTSLGILEWLNPSQAPFTERWSWIKTLVTNAMGVQGTAIIYLGIAAAMFIIGVCFLARHRSVKHA